MLQRKIKGKMKVVRTPSTLCWKVRSLAFHNAEYYVSFDAEVFFAFLVFGDTFSTLG